jgi:transcriptional regulator with XRE-family HTH domain
MSILQQVRTDLLARKNSGDWDRVAAAAGVSYKTITRLAHGHEDNPRLQTIERVAAALKSLPAAEVTT